MKYVYTDGGVTIQTGNGGWAFDSYLTTDESEKPNQSRSGRVIDTTNNIMELYAIHEAIRLHPSSSLTICTDSQNAICWILKQYKVNIKTEKDRERAHLIKKIQTMISERTAPVKFVKVKGHSENNRNNLVDEKAVLAKSFTKFDKIYKNEEQLCEENTNNNLQNQNEINTKWPETILGFESIDKSIIEKNPNQKTSHYRMIVAQPYGPKSILTKSNPYLPSSTVISISTENVDEEMVTIAKLEDGGILVHRGNNLWTISKSLSKIVSERHFLNGSTENEPLHYGMIYAYCPQA